MCIRDSDCLGDRSDRDLTGERRGFAEQHRATEAVAVALHDGHKTVDGTDHRLDVRPPRPLVDGQPHGHTCTVVRRGIVDLADRDYARSLIS